MVCKCCGKEVKKLQLGICKSCYKSYMKSLKLGKQFTKAEKYIKAVEKLDRDDDGYYDSNQWKRFVTSLMKKSKDVYEICPDSVDSSIELVLDDRSKIHIGNPNQSVYYGFLV